MSEKVLEKKIKWHVDHFLTIKDLVKWGASAHSIELSTESLEKVEKARSIFLEALHSGRWIYGSSSGFGPLAGQKIDRSEGAMHQQHLLYHLATGVGEHLSSVQSRTMCVLRLFQLSRGYAGISYTTLSQLLNLYSLNVTPVVPSLGSVGASGDLTPLAHAALAISGEYKVAYKGEVWEGSSWFEQMTVAPVRWKEGEALAYVNGTACMAALAAISCFQAQKVWEQSLLHTFIMGETQAAFQEAWNPLLGEAKPHPGQQRVLSFLTYWGKGSDWLSGSPTDHLQEIPRLPQDPYTIRCAPQLLGAVSDQLAYVEEVVTREINSASGNPTIFTETEEIIHGGNFNGQSLAFAADTLTQALVYMGVYAERRIARMTDPHLNLGLPAYMVRGKLGFQSGLMGAQVTASALVAQLRSLATPLAIQSIPTNNNNQDIVSMGTLAAWRSHQCVELLMQILAIEAILLAEAVEIRQKQFALKSFAQITCDWKEKLRKKCPAILTDRPLSDEIQVIAQEIAKGLLLPS